MEGLPNAYALSPGEFPVRPKVQESQPDQIDNSQTYYDPPYMNGEKISEALGIYLAAEQDGRLCPPDAYAILYSAGLLKTETDGR